MSQATEDKTKDTPAPGKPSLPQSQRQRWVTYGGNVAITCVLAVVAAALLVWIAQRMTQKLGLRADTTAGGVYSLKPQTVNIIQSLDKPIKLVALYPKLKQDERDQQDFRQPVLDLLEDYRRRGRDIEVLAIDPANEPTRFDQWIREIQTKYGGNVKAYEDLLKDFPETLAAIQKLADDEAGRKDTLKSLQGRDDNLGLIVTAIDNTVDKCVRDLRDLAKAIEYDTKETEQAKGRIRDYKGQAEAVRAKFTSFLRNISGLTDLLGQLRDNMELPIEVRKYATDSAPRFEAMKKKADELLERMKALPQDLKLDELRRKLTSMDESQAPPSTIAVMGPDDIKLIGFEDVWKSGETFGAASGGQPRLRFAGEQRITAAMLTLTQTQKKKVAIVRSGGQPLATGMGMQQAPLEEVAERLRSYNFDVVEKDASGQFAMQAMQRGMPAPPEPEWDAVKDAIWIVISVQPNPMMGMGGDALGQKLAEHLRSGGSAMVLFNPDGDKLDAAMKEWGVEALIDTVAVHEPIESAAGSSGDLVEDAKRQPELFVLNRYGDHPLGASLQTLDAVFPIPIVIKTTSLPGYKAASLLPIPEAPKSWGERDLRSDPRRRNPPPTFSAEGDKPDLPGPLSIGAAVEKEGGGRLVAIGSIYFATNDLVSFTDRKLAEKKIYVARFPGNGELLTNSVFWLAKMDNMMALSPAALEVSRIKPMSEGLLSFWRIGGLLVILPGLVIVAGLLVHSARRD